MHATSDLDDNTVRSLLQAVTSKKPSIKYATFFACVWLESSMVLTEETLQELLEYLDKAMTNLAKEAFENLEMKGDTQGIENFFENQFDTRLENLLVAKKSSIHHLESAMKNKIIQRKLKILDKISKQYRN